MNKVKFFLTMVMALTVTFVMAQGGVTVPGFDPSDGVTSEELNKLYIAVLAGINMVVTFFSPVIPGLKNFSNKGKVLLAVGIAAGAVFLFIGKFYGFGDIWQPILALATAHIGYIIGMKPFGMKTATLPGTIATRTREARIVELEKRAGVTLDDLEAADAAERSARDTKLMFEKLEAEKAKEEVLKSNKKSS